MRAFCIRTAAALVVFAPQALAQPLEPIASANDPSLVLRYIGNGIESRCGGDLFVIDLAYWKCLRRDGDAPLEVTELGQIGSGLGAPIVIRGPIAGDRRILFADKSFEPTISALDPVTAEVVVIGSVGEGLSLNNPPMLADHDGDGVPGVVLQDVGSARILSLPPAVGAPLQVVRSLGFEPRFSGQFDNDPQTEVAVVEPDRVRFFDTGSLAEESWSLQGSNPAQRPSVIADWDQDGVDEFAIMFSLGLRLVDPNSGAAPIVFTHAVLNANPSGARIDWQASGSRDIAIWSNNGLAVLNPRTGALLADFFPSEMPSLGRSVALALDWEGDGDGDLMWTTESDGRLFVLRQGSGLAVHQRSALYKDALGYGQVAGSPVLLTAERFSAFGTSELRLRSRDPQSLELDATAALDPSVNSMRCSAADVHASPGSEILCASNSLLRLFAQDGGLLWSRAIGDSITRQYGATSVPDASCVGAQCRRILVQDLPISGGAGHVLRMLGGDTGDEIWNLPLTTFAHSALLLTDLDSDGVVEILFGESLAGSPTARVTALDGITRLQRWQLPGLYAPTALARGRDQSRTLAVIESDGRLSYLDPSTGQRLASALTLSSGSQCTLCRLAYVGAAPTIGAWVVARASAPGLHVISRDLRQPVWRFDTFIPDVPAIVARGNLLHVSAGTFLQTLRLADDGIHADAFEGW